MGYIELEEFSLAEGVGTEEFAARDADLQAWSYLHRTGLVRRTTAIGDGGAVLVVTLFSGTEPPAASASVQGAPGPQGSFAAAVDHASYRRAVYRDLD